ncbi:MAG TPA: hypothetical protein VF997_17445, partial [Polyangia bacterium]
MMAGKQILGDDPFATAEGDNETPPPPLDVAPPKPKKEKAAKAPATDSVPEREPQAAREPEAEREVVETYSHGAESQPSEYGPSIDRP